MKQITNKQYEEYQKYKYDVLNNNIIDIDFIAFVCEANDYNAEKIGQHFLELLPKIREKQSKRR